MSMLEVIVAMGITSVIALALTEGVQYGLKTQKGLNQQLIWTKMKAEVELLFNSTQYCKAIFHANPTTGPFYFTPGDPATTVLTTDVALRNQPLSIPRQPPTLPAYAAGLAVDDTGRKAEDKNGIIIDSITMGATTLQTPAPPTSERFTIPVTIEAHKDHKGTADQAIGATRLSYTTTIKLTQSTNPAGCPGPTCTYNDIISCVTSADSSIGKYNCQALGGQWDSSATPKCNIIAAPVPAPPALPAPSFASGAYTNLCPNGMAVSGIDYSEGYGRVACTYSSPGDGASCFNGAGVLRWVPDASLPYPNGGRYQCTALPGACATGEHLTWNGTSFSCLVDTFKNSTTCTPGQYSYWNGSQFACGTVQTPGTDLVGSCVGNDKFLKWDGTTKKYTCGTFSPSNLPSCNSASASAKSILIWTGSDFQCADPKISSTATSCSSGQLLFYDTATNTFECKSPTYPAAAPIPTRACSPYVLAFSSGSYTCAYPPPSPTPAGVVPPPIEETYCLTQNGYNYSANSAAQVYCPAGWVGVGACGAGGNGDCDNNKSKSSLTCCKNSKTGTRDYDKIATSWGQPLFCNNPNDAVVSICMGKSGLNCGSGARYKILCRENVFDSNYNVSLGLSHEGCRVVSSKGYGEHMRCGPGEYMVGYCNSDDDDEDCKVNAFNTALVFGNKVMQPFLYSDKTFNTQIYCCPVPEYP
jgi:hypothetical protein